MPLLCTQKRVAASAGRFLDGLPREERVSAAHRAKLAYVYVRQSSVNQVCRHRESTELQYRPVDRAVGLGRPRERVLRRGSRQVGAASAERHGFQRLITAIGPGNAGPVA